MISTLTHKIIREIENTDYIRRIGHVNQFLGGIIESIGPDVFLGEVCEIHSKTDMSVVKAEVVGFKEGKVQLIPFGNLRGIQVGSEVVSTGTTIKIPVGEELLGNVIDAFGNPLTSFKKVLTNESASIFDDSENPLLRPKISQRLETGIKIIDTLLPIGKGQKLGIFSGSGVGKSSLLGMLAKNVTSDVNVIALVGERGREVVEFIEDILGEDGLKKSVLVVATSEQSALARAHAAFSATAIAEYFCNKGKDVLLMMDSLTRLAMAQREIGLLVGEPPTSRGYTPSVFATLPRLIERAGTSSTGGSITGLYTVLVEGDDMSDPISDYARATLDGHIVLSRDLANAGVYPAIDILHSKSRLSENILNELESKASRDVVEIYSQYYEYRDMISIGAYKTGTNPSLDNAINKHNMLKEFFRQNINEHVSLADTNSAIQKIVS